MGGNTYSSTPNTTNPDHEPKGTVIKGTLFGEALEALKHGDKITRKGWAGKEMFLVVAYPTKGLTVATNIEFNRVLIAGEAAPLENFIALYTTDEKIEPWIPSHADILAEDWVVVGR